MEHETDHDTQRRLAVKTIAVGTAGLAIGLPLARAQAAKEVKIADLAKLAKDHDTAAFDYEGDAALLVRVPEAVKDRTLEVSIAGQKAHLAAYTLVCTHLGCKPEAPNADHALVCGCHGSTFSADGAVVKGPARKPLAGIKLEVRQNAVFAVGLL